MPFTCCMVSSFTALSFSTTTASASSATLYSPGSTPLALALAISSALIGRLEFARVVVLFMSAAIPVPDPPPVTWIVTPGFFPI
jgi:hypothetical protein